MFSLISLGRGAWAKLQAAHPVIRWGGAIFVGVALLDFFAHEAIDLYVKTQTARATIEKTNADAVMAETQKIAITAHPPTFAEIKARAQETNSALGDIHPVEAACFFFQMEAYGNDQWRPKRDAQGRLMPCPPADVEKVGAACVSLQIEAYGNDRWRLKRDASRKAMSCKEVN